MLEVAARVLTAPINSASIFASLLGGDDGAEALADDGEPRVEHLSNKVP
jgi:hypothetical protein